MIYLFLADGFEEIEALAPLDILRRAGLNVTTVGIGGKHITGSHKIAVEADTADTDLKLDDIEMIILPGGMPGTKNLDKSPVVHDAIKKALDCDAYICAICAAPMILGKLGLLKGRNAVCYPGFEDYLTGATIPLDKDVVTDEKIITARGMGVAVDFGLLLASKLCGQEKANDLASAIIAKQYEQLN